MYRSHIVQPTAVHCFASGCLHRDPRHCIMRPPPFYVKNSHSAARHISRALVRSYSDSTSSSSHSSNYSSFIASNVDPSPPVTSARIPDSLVKCRTKSHNNRKVQQDRIVYLLAAVAEGRLENSLLYHIFNYSYKHNRSSRLGHAQSAADFHTPAADPLCHVPADCPEDTLPHLRHLMYPLSQSVQQLLGQRYISGATTSSLLEFLLNRRNMWGTTHSMLTYVYDDAERARRRCSPYRTATTAQDADAIVQLAVRLYCRETSHHHHDQRTLSEYVQQRLGNLTMAAIRVDNVEASFPPFHILVQGAPDSHHATLPLSPTTPDMVEFESPTKKRRIHGASRISRCSRCGTAKIAGSGHERSKCPDGFSISSPVPYQSSPYFAL